MSQAVAAPLQKTALHARHVALQAKMMDFHGWDLPLYYTSILDEHRAVREALGLFDISHMGQVLVTGATAVATLDALVVSDLTQVAEGRACYTMMLNEQGGIIDDLIIYRIGDDSLLVIVNAANRRTDVDWMQAHRQAETTITDISAGRSILAVQGPKACHVLEQILDAKVTGLTRFGIAPLRTMGPDACIARTGYTGGDGFELFLPDKHAIKLWDEVLFGSRALGGRPAGLGARDTLRVEGGLRLYGTDMDTQTSPWEAGLDWTVAMGKAAFIGKEPLARQRRDGLKRRLVGFEMGQGPVPRTGCAVRIGDREAGRVTSGTFSVMLNRPIGMAYVDEPLSAPGTELGIQVRSQVYPASVVKMPFWKTGKPVGDSRTIIGPSAAGATP